MRLRAGHALLLLACRPEHGATSTATPPTSTPEVAAAPAEPPPAPPSSGPSYDASEAPEDDDAGAVEVRTTHATVKGSLLKDEIRAVVRAHLGEVRSCYNAALLRGPDARGRVAVQFTIDPEGRVPVAVIAQSDVPDGEIGPCLVDVVKHWVFPKPEGGGNVVVTYPFVFVPG